MKLSKDKTFNFTLYFILALGVAFRFVHLSKFFGHVDDNSVVSYIFRGKEIGVGWVGQAIEVSKDLTFAPLQYFFTSMFLSIGYPLQEYREILFLGRLPSAIISSISLLLLAFMMRKNRVLALFPLAVFAFSLENLIYAKHMSPYSAGVLGFLLMGVIYSILEKRFSYLSMVLMALLMGLIAHFQYQILLLFPAVYAGVLAHQLFAEKKKLKEVLGPFLLGGIFLILSILPMYLNLLKKIMYMAVHWNKGPSGEFLFPSFRSLEGLEKVYMPVWFFIKNTFIVFWSNFGVSENVVFATSISGLIFAFFIMFFYFFKKDPNLRKSGFWVFVVCTIGIWIIFVWRKKLTLGPTRHVLIFAPAALIMASFTYKWALNKLFKEKQKVIDISLAIITLFFFILGYGNFYEQRRDKFDEQDLINRLSKNKAQGVIFHGYTTNALFFSNVKKKFSFYEERFSKKIGLWDNNIKRVAFVSHRGPIQSDNAKELLQKVSGRSLTLNKIKSDHQSSETEIEYLNHTKNGTNGLFIDLFRVE